ncbi:hypothetical protein AUEXF2481DRAFT_142262 [Aureobasidium subglaciale EXF-2481]|uniref:Zn(2)-C6 fungal-type domain-containing protein n=1 Tax=Aureobasidium subglaciale (strain EXF-2481) TaxID=1043005 RepID=A0A074Z2J5_AURSE|nr:uncharacterized protein AUEXF2481DRAFT_142262 [Aureobasidium subglaciale EXF-2481]KAI5199484.1 hypothetical protein E4T38_06980 [Aureobasidium subglaciale]KAI5218371.1 hypothetical protein E4T40_06911 [Aureobasidium subglaciale]KAI5221962.1 hypothetical protein E4T41_06831 [Aureobasidium subglaciale]KAI5259258.1 hypothetical protein E4T46_06809 [Aureobasidium subglaciale]KER00553.1 hypothetical protein AUEXF2481DRAFT_142262 [Aureobasidium subglaciale EXF-2481]
MVFETPLLRVSRPVAACSRCRSAKIKCDGKLPACTACERSGKQAECSSTNDQFARGKERSYVSTLETRIEKLERRLQESQHRKASIVTDHDHNHDGAVLRHVPSEGGNRTSKRLEAQEIDDLVSDFGYLTVNATARDFYGFTSSMSYARMVLSACTKDSLPPGFVTPLPPRNEAMITIRHYFENFFVMYPFFEESSFYASIDAVYNSENLRNFTASPFDHFSVRLVLAIAHAGRMEQRGDGNYMAAIGHVSAALVHAEHVLRPGSIASVQAMLLLHEYSMIDPHHFDSWGLIGAASRAMVDLGLHQDPPRSTSISRAKLELRRRVFWCVYGFDRTTSLIQSRAFSFSDDSANVALPFSVAQTLVSPDAKDDSNHILFKSFGSAIDLFNLRRIQSDWYTELFQSGRIPLSDPYPTIWRSCEAMRSWFAGLSLSMSPQVRTFFELNLLYSYIYILAASPRMPFVAPFAQSLIFEHCIQYAEKMTSHANERVKTAPLSFYDAMRVYMTGRQFIEVLQGNEDRLLSGIIPDPPHVPVDSAPPPPAPHTPRDFQKNLMRSITCIKRLTDCLGLFGLRWGYMSWRDRFQRDSESLLSSLNQRVWKRQDSSNGPARPVWNFTDSVVPLADTVMPPSGPQQHLQPLITPTYPPEFQQSTAFYQSQYNGSVPQTNNQYPVWHGHNSDAMGPLGDQQEQLGMPHTHKY